MWMLDSEDILHGVLAFARPQHQGFLMALR
jgi:hypothetical protein